MMRFAVALFLILQVVLMSPLAVAKGKNGGGGQANGFPGAGRMEDWKASQPEFKAGVACMNQKKWDDAINHFRASITLYQYQPRAYLEIGRAIEAKSGDISDAEKAYRKALDLDTSNWRAWKRLGNVLFMEKRWGEARESVASAIQLQPPPKERAELDSWIQRIEAGSRSADASAQ